MDTWQTQVQLKICRYIRVNYEGTQSIQLMIEDSISINEEPSFLLCCPFLIAKFQYERGVCAGQISKLAWGKKHL